MTACGSAVAHPTTGRLPDGGPLDPSAQCQCDCATAEMPCFATECGIPTYDVQIVCDNGTIQLGCSANACANCSSSCEGAYEQCAASCP